MEEKEVYSYFCEKCQYGTNIKNSFDRHNTSNYHITGVKTRKVKINKISHKCSDCAYTTPNNVNILLHKLNNHATIEERKKGFKYYCELCNFGVFAESSFTIHNKSKSHTRISEIFNKKI